ncbi:MAG TPA: hypothetical protein VGB77_14315 [Abditibacteriaceae bacterium]|jgi:5-methylcytosine-specific restriction endonuclease McrBC regulatory subunit McrC
MHDIVRLCEWGRASINDWSAGERALTRHAIAHWQNENHLPVAPLTCDETGLRAQQWVGVVEAAGRTIEIYPKLDATLLDKNTLPQSKAAGMMSNLLWMLDVAEHRDLADADLAGLDSLESFFDLFAWILARRLLNELEGGLPHHYLLHSDVLRSVRGRLDLTRQVTTLWDRHDRVACLWDEFTPDTSLMRLFKCALRFLQPRVSHATTVGLVSDCLSLLDEVSDIAPFEALAQARVMFWDRNTERFRLSHDLARRLLGGYAPALGSGSEETFVFLMDMNKVFENYVTAVLEHHFATLVRTQECLGTLFRLERGGIRQYADYLWQSRGALWIGDAKYKHLTKASGQPLTFATLNAETTSFRAGQVLNAGDVRQLTVYAELSKIHPQLKTLGAPHLALLYPYTGNATLKEDTAVAWNGAFFHLMPVRVGGFAGAPNLNEVLGAVSLIHG